MSDRFCDPVLLREGVVVLVLGLSCPSCPSRPSHPSVYMEVEVVPAGLFGMLVLVMVAGIASMLYRVLWFD